MFSVCGILGSDAGETVDSASAEPVAGAFQGEEIGVVDDAVDHRGGDCLVSEGRRSSNSVISATLSFDAEDGSNR